MDRGACWATVYGVTIVIINLKKIIFLSKKSVCLKAGFYVQSLKEKTVL